MCIIMLAILSQSYYRMGEFPLDTIVDYGGAYEEQSYCAVAFDGTNYLVAFQDHRAGHHWDIFGVRIAEAGTILDTANIPISLTNRIKANTAIAFDGTNFLVVWDELETQTNERNICGTFVTSSGVVLDTIGFTISNAPDWQSDPKVVFGGANYLVVWSDCRNHPYEPDIYGARLTPAGVLLDPSGIKISSADKSQAGAEVAFDGTNYLVVWSDRRNIGTSPDIYCTLVTPSGIVLDTCGIPIDSTQSDDCNPSLSFDGTNFYCAWSRDIGSTWDVYGTRINSNGILIDTGGVFIATTTHYWIPDISVACCTDNYIVTWDDMINGYLKVRGAMIDTSGNVIDTLGCIIDIQEEDFYRPAAVCGSSAFFLAMDQLRGIEGIDVYGTRISLTGNILDTLGIVLSSGAEAQLYSSAVFSGSEYMVVWDEWNGHDYDICGIRVDTDGTVLGTMSTLVSVSDSHQTRPSIAFDGNNYLIVWQDQGNYNPYSGITDIICARLNQNGVLIDSSGIPITTSDYDQKYPAIAFDGTNYLVVWNDARYPPNSRTDICAARVTPAGIVLDTAGIIVSSAVNSQVYSDVIYGKSNYLVMWDDFRNDYGGWDNSDIFCARVATNGSVLDTSGLMVSTAPNNQRYPSIAYDQSNTYLAVWEDWRNVPANSNTPDIYGARLDTNGVLLDTTAIPICVNSQYFHGRPTVGYDGTNFVIVWQDDRNGHSHDLYGAKINSSGTIVSTFSVCETMYHQLRPSITQGNDNGMLLTFSGYCDSINNKPVYTMRIFGQMYPFIGISENIHIECKKLALHAYPNPFSQCLQISTPQPIDNGSVKVFDITGRFIIEITGLEDGVLHWNGIDQENRQLPNGVYFIQLSTENSVMTQKVLLIR